MQYVFSKLFHLTTERFSFIIYFAAVLGPSDCFFNEVVMTYCAKGFDPMVETAEDIAKSCCFTGHRYLSALQPDIRDRLICEIETLINEKGVEYFYTGGARGFDTIAATCVLQLKGKYPFIRLCLALPCKNQADRWSEAEKAGYERILKLADRVYYVSDAYTEGCMLERNDFMLNKCKYCISYLRRLMGGTYYTVTMAKRLERELIMI